MFYRKGTVTIFGICIIAAINVTVMSEFLWSNWVESENVTEQSLSQLLVTATTPSLVNCVVVCSELSNNGSATFNSGTSSCGCYDTANNTNSQSASRVWRHIPLGYDGSMSQGFYVKFYNDYWKTYDEANTMCALDGARLVVLDTMEKINVILTSADFTLNYYYLVAATDNLQEDTFVWSTGSPVSRDANIWHDFQPNNADGNQNCVALKQSKYDDVRCTDDFKFICELL